VRRKELPEEPLVTIYICAYNAAKWIEKAVASALEQTYRHLEILIVDDGSTDDTVARVQDSMTDESTCTASSTAA
jgi:glycosyltransferase involved in cell wall biosynthesis